MQMSAKVRAYAAQHSKLRRSSKTVILQIAHYANDDGTSAYPSIRTIARDCGISPSAVNRALRTARESGELDIQYNLGPHGTNLYRIRLENIGSLADLEAAGLAAPSRNDTPVILTPKGSTIRGNQYSCSSLRSVSSPDPEISKSSERILGPKPRSSRLWAKRGDPDWQCPMMTRS